MISQKILLVLRMIYLMPTTWPTLTNLISTWHTLAYLQGSSLFLPPHVHQPHMGSLPARCGTYPGKKGEISHCNLVLDSKIGSHPQTGARALQQTLAFLHGFTSWLLPTCWFESMLATDQAHPFVPCHAPTTITIHLVW